MHYMPQMQGRNVAYKLRIVEASLSSTMSFHLDLFINFWVGIFDLSM
jgi:hypothetical protein